MPRNYSSFISCRMFPETFEVVLQLIGPGLRVINTLPGRKPISAEKQLLIAIWFMSTPDSYRSVSTKFGIGKATAFRALRRVTCSTLYCSSVYSVAQRCSCHKK
ncbi:uncharacterized protein LOC105428678 [Pogonomyrmex barbatus]|uniref:Uncharacterized protein LOC105428678 n=1 Tax=Pogonomyrmex barbatus TaxID=144034 RepID=A0A6I9WEN2_9HYME|nr:uncharacterized protein LOC105428678 [Pogonomyrmex barbatus]